jgi:hypothetical protein
MTNEEILTTEGWEVECELPFEIRHTDGSFATGQAADIVLEYLKDEHANQNTTRKVSL